MIRLVLAAVLAFLTVRAHRNAPKRDESSLARARAQFALAFLALSGALIPLGFAFAEGWRGPLLVLAALAGIVAWDAAAQLLATLSRRRDVWMRGFWLGVAAITLATPAPWAVPAVFATLGALAFRWRHTVPTRPKYALVLAAISLSALGYFRVASLSGVASSEALPGWQLELWSVGNALRLALAMLSSLAAWILLLAIVRDPSLGVRTVGRRLALSHILVVLVPLVLLLTLWSATTVLGVNRDRALVAARALAGETTRLHDGLSRALDGGTGGAEAFAQASGGAAAGVRAWVAERGILKRVSGDPLARGEQAAAAWLDSLTRLPDSSLVTLDDAIWVGAAVRRGVTGAVVLVPADSLASRLASFAAGAPTRLTTSDGGVIMPDRDSTSGLSVTPAAVQPDTLLAAEPDSDRAAADTLERNKLHVSVGQARYRMDNQNLSAGQFLFEGHAFVPALGWSSGKWNRGQLLLSVTVPWRRVLSGLFDNSETDPMGYIPAVLLGTLGVLMALVFLWNVMMVTSMARGVALAIGALHGAARKLESGDLTHRIELRGEDDLWDVGRAVNRAAEGLERAQAADKDRARMESELAVARRIQARLLPAGPPSVPGLEIAGASEAAREVGGDYFDHIDMGDGRVALVIADVSGKGVPAALLMSAFRAALVSHDLRHEEPAALAGRLNDFLHRSVESGKFVTAFIAFLDSGSGELHYVNAGHNPSLLVRADGSHEWLAEGGTILGILPMSVFTSGRVTLNEGDVLTLYTDGVTEGADATNEQWGEERLVETLLRLRRRSCAEIARALVTEVRAFEGDTGPADDLTVIVARRAP
ncbi:MAG: PP2C family protein-serine/threonine phosphatase [Candidatus Eisenbacteria bacterium]|nr:PP2C family protein-serine/threonine phosphatase [Candidatus Eisenbacteria bacterium]